MTEPTENTGTKTPRGLTYRGDAGVFSVYDFWLRGRIVLEVAVDNEMKIESGDEFESRPDTYRIYVGKPGAVEALHSGDNDALVATNGRAVKHTYLDGDGVHVHVVSETVRSYVRPRLAVLLARVFVPGEVTPTS